MLRHFFAYTFGGSMTASRLVTSNAFVVRILPVQQRGVDPATRRAQSHGAPEEAL